MGRTNAHDTGRQIRAERQPWGPNLVLERFVMANGLIVLALVDHQAPVVCYQTWFKVGSRHERKGKSGIAHLFEHLMFNETENLPYGEFDRQLEAAGADSNASTYLDWTYYVVQLPAEALELVMRLEADRMQNLVLRDEQVASEREVVANERRQSVDDDVDGAVSELLYAKAFAEHGYGRPTIGLMNDIEGLSTEDCRVFYRTYYAPNNATVVAVGDIDVEQMKRLAAKYYGSLDRSEIPVEHVYPEPPQSAERTMAVTKASATNKVVIGYRACSFGDFDHPALVLLNEILFGGRSSRVHRSLVQRQELATSVRGGVGTFRDPALYELWLTGRGQTQPQELIAALDELLTAVVDAPVSEEELDRAKARIELAALQSLETVCGKAGQIGFYETVLGDPGSLFNKLDAYRRAERSDLLRVARRYLRRSGRCVVEVKSGRQAPTEEVS